MHDFSIQEDLRRRRENVIAQGHVSAFEGYVEKAAGALIHLSDGREIIDFSGGIAVMNVGHSHSKVVAAVKDQVEKYTHTCFMVVPYAPAIELAERLSAIVPGTFPKSVLWLNSGAEAVENAVKIARYHTKRPAVIAFNNAFHGRTFMAMTLTGKVKPYKQGFGPFMPEVYRMPFAYCYRCPFSLRYPDCETYCADYLEEFFLTHVAAEQTAALIVEPVQGEGGFITPPDGYFKKLERICQNNGIVLLADEIQTGMGRTGKMFAMEHWDVSAPLTIVAKSLAAGMPLSAVVGHKTIMDGVHPSGIGGTYGGNPVACRAGLAVIEVIETEDLLTKGVEIGRIVRNRFNDFKNKYELVGDVRGLGPMLAMELVKDRESKTPAADEARTLTASCFQKGLLLLTCGSFGNVIRVSMPLIIGAEQLEKGLMILEEALVELG
jgi:4-aminobutyrate aminotransferase/(S)-3-amino-2-methylpropionate transaminase